MDLGTAGAIAASSFAVAGGIVGVIKIIHGNNRRDGEFCSLHEELAKDVKDIGIAIRDLPLRIIEVLKKNGG